MSIAFALYSQSLIRLQTPLHFTCVAISWVLVSLLWTKKEHERQLVEGHESNIEIDETALNTIVDQMRWRNCMRCLQWQTSFRTCRATLHFSRLASQNTMYIAKRNDVLLMDYHVILTLYNLYYGRLAHSRDLRWHTIENGTSHFGGFHSRIWLLPEKDYVSKFLTVASDMEKLKSMEKKLVEIKSHEKQTRLMAIVLVFGSVAASVAAGSQCSVHSALSRQWS